MVFIAAMKSILTFLAFSSFTAATLSAGPLTEARVTQIINDVSVVEGSGGGRKAELQDVIRGQTALKTGIKSRSELLFQDNTLTRVGPESYFSFKAGTRDMTLGQGTMLLQVPKGLGGAKIRAAAITAGITGTTIMMEYRPNRNLKVLVLEGSLRLSGPGSSPVDITAGRMVIMHPNARTIPQPVAVDIKKVMKTSSLVNMRGGKKTAALPSAQLIEKEIAAQEQRKEDKTLSDTNLFIMGEGTKVVVADDDLYASLNRNANIATALVTTDTPAVDRTTVANANPTSTPAANAAPQPVIPPLAAAAATPVAHPASTPAAQGGSTPQPASTPPPLAGSTPASTPPAQPASSPEPGSTPVPQPGSTPATEPSATPIAQPSSTPIAQPSRHRPQSRVPPHSAAKLDTDDRAECHPCGAAKRDARHHPFTATFQHTWDKPDRHAGDRGIADSLGQSWHFADTASRPERDTGSDCPARSGTFPDAPRRRRGR